MKNIFKLSIIIAVLSALGCAPSASQLEKVVSENPEILFNAIEKHPGKFIEVVNKAARNAQMEARQKEAEDEQKRMEDEFKNPKQPKISDGRAVFGKKDAPITIVEYSDFECPYCAKGYDTMKEVMKEYQGKVKVIYKHLPLEFHPMAMPAAKYFEAMVIQSPSKAEKFHDMIFENQNKLKSQKEAYLKDAAKKVGADMNKLMKDLDSDAVKKVIEADMAEAKEFGFSGTPGFLVNGVSLKGAYPYEEFKKII
ncbi:MAG: DsbA family protein, partial [Bdellovibrionales bacterium]|nr:DsbA family protein [Bdellovibrionales bacterium]